MPMDQRQDPRKPFTEAVQFRVLDGRMREQVGAALQGAVARDISRGGLRLWTDRFIPVDTRLELNIEFGEGETNRLPARVRWVRQLPYSESYQVGVLFETENTEPTARSVLEQYLTQSGPHPAA